MWLDLRNYSTDHPSKKLDVKNAQFKVTQVVSPHAYRLDTPGNIHNVFHVSLLRPVANNPLPSQYVDDTELPAIQGESGHEEWQIEEISDSKLDRRGHGQPRRKYLVKWQGYHMRTWEPEEFVEQTAVLDEFIAKFPEKPHPPPN